MHYKNVTYGRIELTISSEYALASLPLVDVTQP